jgi:hypothetical protein
MSKILKRPMFRRGGEVGGGIMSGIRQNYEVGGTARERLMKAFEEYPVQGVDPLSQFLIQGGLNLMSATPRGGVLATAAEAFKEPTAGLFKGLGTEQRAKREIALAGEQIDIESDLSKQLAEIKAKAEEQYLKDSSPDRKHYELYSKYTDPTKKGYLKSVEQDFPGAMADFGSYIQESLRQRGEDVIGIIPYRKSGQSYDWNFDEMIPGAKYFKPDTKKLYERDPKNNILIEFNPYTGEKLNEYQLKKPKG